MARARRRWIREQGMLDPARLVFIDETAVSTNLARVRGRAPSGDRVIGTVPLGAWETIDHLRSGPWTYRIQGCGATEPRPKAGSPLIVIATALACRRARSCLGMAWQGRSMPQGWGDSQPCTDFARTDVSDAQVGTEKRALRSNQETDEGKLRRPGQLLDKENPIQGPKCQFRREARARERHRHRIGG